MCAALDLGIADFSMTGVARALGVTTPALYRLFLSRDDLLEDCLRTVCTQFPLVTSHVSWREMLEQYAAVLWEMFTRYPGMDSVFTTFRRSIRRTIPQHIEFYRSLQCHGFSVGQAHFAGTSILHLTTAASALLSRHREELIRDFGKPGARVFLADGGRILTDVTDLEETTRRQWWTSVTFFLRALEQVAPEWPEYSGPLPVPPTDL